MPKIKQCELKKESKYLHLVLPVRYFLSVFFVLFLAEFLGYGKSFMFVLYHLLQQMSLKPRMKMQKVPAVIWLADIWSI
ncbi:hypothetical protein VNO78_34760 [Psophocarpus tetragonolobus]|uniref:Uncharacterized protein n=1 Tax=Psophocarpus tetragonolobus TaxID=3891 RepID=A0AAN9RLQ0_PSOTE